MKKSIARVLINAINPEITDVKRINRLNCRRKMFEVLEDYVADFTERCEVVDNFFSLVRFDDPEYKALEDETIHELRDGIKKLIGEIETGKVTQLGEAYESLLLMVSEADD